MLQQELISIIMPVYNSEKYIKESVQCILDQTYSNYEFIIIDDGSIDKSVVIIKRFKDSRIRLFECEHKGIVKQLNYGLNIAKGKYIARMDADDLCNKNRLKMQIDYLVNNSNILLVGTNYYYINSNNKIISKKKLPEYHEDIEFMMPINASILHPTILTYKSVFDEVGSYKEEFWLAEDHELFLRMLKYNIRCYNIQNFLYSYRNHSSSTSFKFETQAVKASYRYGSDYINYKYDKNSYEFIFSMGLIEYYKGDIKQARKLFKQAKSHTLSNTIIWRYLFFTYLGNKLINLLRSKKILWKLSLFVNKVFLIDFNIIKKKIFI